MEKQPRCKDCKVCEQYPGTAFCVSPIRPFPGKIVNPGQYACKKFVYPDK